ncbi:pseudouridine synthase [Wolinella succinogenes]|uniref:pseudouridine synthase n=1 Tax=Wolinella succinogenes TaxID=844 RepID=UPI001693F6CC|nr:pseudouridine synthase [Wolinella succinogenes]NLU33832.1 rRNA pseudouridine synthase [Wolinella succinogenes]
MRLNQYISHHSKYSRREADELIKAGRVNIEKRKIENLATQVKEGERVFIDGKFLKEKSEENYTVIVYHKPKGELVTKSDDRGRKTIYDSLPSGFKHFIPVGRLDFASEGLLLLTDSPKVAKALMESELERVYHLKIDKRVSPEMIKAMEEGLVLEDASAGGHEKSEIKSMSFSPFAGFEVAKDSPTHSKIKVAIKEGKNRELRRFFAHFGAKVLDLKRVSYGWVSLNALPDGKNRYLNRSEYNKLHAFMKELQKSEEKEKKPRKASYRSATKSDSARAPRKKG